MATDVGWTAVQWPGLEHVIVSADQTGWRADGRVILAEDRLVSVGYQVRCDAGFRVGGLTISVTDAAGATSLVLEADTSGRWQANRQPRPDLDGCTDVDIDCTPLTNTLPIRRLPWSAGQARDLDVVYVSVPSLSVRAARQRYTLLAPGEHDGDDGPALAVFRYESGSFRADLTVDDDGFVIDYPGLWQRVAATGGRPGVGGQLSGIVPAGSMRQPERLILPAPAGAGGKPGRLPACEAPLVQNAGSYQGQARQEHRETRHRDDHRGVGIGTELRRRKGRHLDVARLVQPDRHLAAGAGLSRSRHRAHVLQSVSRPPGERPDGPGVRAAVCHLRTWSRPEQDSLNFMPGPLGVDDGRIARAHPQPGSRGDKRSQGQEREEPCRQQPPGYQVLAPPQRVAVPTELACQPRRCGLRRHVHSIGGPAAPSQPAFKGLSPRLVAFAIPTAKKKSHFR